MFIFFFLDVSLVFLFFYIYFTNFTSLPFLCRQLWIFEDYFGLIWEYVTRDVDVYINRDVIIGI